MFDLVFLTLSVKQKTKTTNKQNRETAVLKNYGTKR